MTEEPAGLHRILCLYAYPYDGNVRPLGDSSTVTVCGAPAMNVIATEVEDIVQVLYLDDERYAPVFTPAPTLDQWPKNAR